MRGMDRMWLKTRTARLWRRRAGLHGLWSIGVCALFLIGALVQCSQASSDSTPAVESVPSASAVPSVVQPETSTPPVVPPVPTALLPANEVFIRVSQQAMASVVNIASSRPVQQSQQTPFFDTPFFRRFFGEEFERQFRAPKKRQEQGLGSGVIVSPDGYIVTNHHVVEQADTLTVLLGDKRTFAAELIGTDPKTDLAVIKIPAMDLPTLPWGDSATLQVGEMVLAVGNPFGLNQTVTMGIVSAVGRANVGIVDYENFIQTDAAINPGNSGGALVNLRGELIGINTAIFSRTGGYMGIGFAIPSTMVQHVMRSLIAQGTVVRGWLGVSIQELTPDLAEQFSAPDANGALVSDVFDQSPAARSGIERGDIIRRYNEFLIRDPAHLRTLVAETAPKSRIALSVWRAGSEHDLVVTIAEMPQDIAALTRGPARANAEDHPLTGLTVEPVPRASEHQAGVIVTRVEPESPAAHAGLRRGDILLEIDRTPIHTIEDFRRLTDHLDATRSVLVLLQRGTGTMFLSITPRQTR